MKQAKMEEGNGVDHFACIPEELLLLILSRIDDLKHLCRYSLVSKRFALAIYELRSVHLTLPSTIRSTESADEICELLPKLAGFTREEMIEFIKSSLIKELGFFSFLRNFRELRSISLDLTCPRSICSSSYWKVRVKFSNGGALVDLFLELPAYVSGQASSSSSDEAYSSDETSSSDESSSDDDVAPADEGMRNNTLFLFRCCSIWLLVLCLLIKYNPSLVSVTITNRKKAGRVFVSNVNLLARRNKLKEAQLGSLDQTIAWMCDSKILESGYMVKVVNYGTLDELDHDSGMLDVGDVVTWEYTGDEKDLRDLLLEFVGKYKESFP
ncbi:uncharacterized protein LOC125204744 [Salvia hispanica]|uniref:uncharacterized protein LOC125204744 n=1 Tax=Salvia hispanica TaxID=49212 RepID=UPI0020092918|nr:uncharacterized protein LOC125204744 [Salvia hispanica]XP_047959424.1 uncharacterized protein LOC125204744 [Salvia hispanica]